MCSARTSCLRLENLGTMDLALWGKGANHEAMATRLITIPGIGKTFEKDFARIGIECVEDLRGQEAELLFEKLTMANRAEDHATSKNYLYVIRLAVYFANGGRDPDKLKWSAHK